MRLTCLKCGHQMEIATEASGVRVSCVCGHDYSLPRVVNTGTRPSEEAAERSRSKAFRAAGLVKNVGGFSLGIALLGILFFPIALLGAGIGIYTLTMIRGPLGRYSGRRAAMLAVVIGSAVFLVEGVVAANWLKNRRLAHLAATQASVSEDLRALLRAERLFRATHDTYGTFSEFRFRPPSGKYTVYLGPDDLVRANRDGEEITDPLPDGLVPAVTETTFTAFAVANIDSDPFVDVWLLNDYGTMLHIADDSTNEERPTEATDEEAEDADSEAEEAGEKEAEDADSEAEEAGEEEAEDADSEAEEAGEPDADSSVPGPKPAEPSAPPSEPSPEPGPTGEPDATGMPEASPPEPEPEAEVRLPPGAATIDDLIDGAPE